MNGQTELVFGSSLAAQICPEGANWKLLGFQGRINLYRVKNELERTNMRYKRVWIIMGNDILSSRLHWHPYGAHKCLVPINVSEVCMKYQVLYDILSCFTSEIRFIQPPPRCERRPVHQRSCITYNKQIHERFRTVINSIQRTKTCILGVLSCEVYRPRFGKLTAEDDIHLSGAAIRSINEFLSR